MIPSDVALEAVVLANEAGLVGTKVVGYGYSGVATAYFVLIITPYYET